MKTASILTPNLTVAEVVRKYPETVHVWIALKTDCIGCHLMQFCSLEYIAESYNMELQALINELEKAINKDTGEEFLPVSGTVHRPAWRIKRNIRLS